MKKFLIIAFSVLILIMVGAVISNYVTINELREQVATSSVVEQKEKTTPTKSTQQVAHVEKDKVSIETNEHANQQVVENIEIEEVSKPVDWQVIESNEIEETNEPTNQQVAENTEIEEVSKPLIRQQIAENNYDKEHYDEYCDKQGYYGEQGYCGTEGCCGSHENRQVTWIGCGMLALIALGGMIIIARNPPEDLI